MAGVTRNNQLLAANVRSLALEKIQAALLGEDEDFKKQLLLKLSGSILPRLNEHSGPDGTPILIMPAELIAKNATDTKPSDNSDIQPEVSSS